MGLEHLFTLVAETLIFNSILWSLMTSLIIKISFRKRKLFFNLNKMKVGIFVSDAVYLHGLFFQYFKHTLKIHYHSPYNVDENSVTCFLVIKDHKIHWENQTVKYSRIVAKIDKNNWFPKGKQRFCTPV